jgi:Na+/proline symporter
LASFVLLGLGALAVAFGLFWLGCAFITPTQPPPSLNEGPALFGVAGLFLIVVGSGFVFLGLVVSAILKASRPLHEIVSAEWAREHKRLW